MTRRLNLGAGHAIVGDALNVDLTRHRPGIDLAVDVPAEWTLGPRGWELIGGQIGAAYEALSGVRDADPEGVKVPAVRKRKAADKEPAAEA